MFLVCFPRLQSLFKMVSSHKRTNFQRSKFFSLSIVPHLRREAKKKENGSVLSPESVPLFELSIIICIKMA